MDFFSPGKVIAAVQPLATRRSAKNKRSAETLFV
jgi:hypothetical protein